MVRLCGSIVISPDKILFRSASEIPPICEFSFPTLGIQISPPLSFEDSIRVFSGKPFEELSPAERGGLWASRFDIGLVLAFPSGTKCFISKIPS